ncbi:MAG: transcription factor S [Candidatus Methanomethylophilaceae archaeon]|nr:transcription factor S [Candidatus Methanomethylophilaceae archaeon]
MFCPECGSLMFPRDGVYGCSRCNCQKEIGTAQCFVTDAKSKETVVINDSVATLPKTRILCPECGHKEAFFVLRQTRSADEPETRIYRCCKCNASWREY